MTTESGALPEEPALPEKHTSWFDNVGIAPVILFIAAVTLLWLGNAIEAKHDLVRALVRDLGIALFVSFVVVVTIEQKSRSELNRTVTGFLVATHKNLFQTILGVEFPAPMFDFVRDRLMKEPIFRTNTEVHYTIEPLNKDAPSLYGFPTIVLSVTSSYTMKNLADREHRHPIRFFFEQIEGRPLDPPELFVDGKRIVEDELKHSDAAWKDRPGLKRYEYEVVMPPKDKKVVELRHKNVKLLADSECWRGLHPCDGLRFSITHPVELVVRVDATHPDELITIQDNDVSYVGQIARPLFPANGFLFWWYPRQDSANVIPPPQIV